ncbi:Dps family protein [Atopobium fossor]|uniref:Dps family protein n=1 Tax=Atopobium fossor TaxID=39487 RepID=UPI00041DCDE4|nr:DNA starvation/stationary phase protection protein [Atopobium fossor]
MLNDKLNVLLSNFVVEAHKLQNAHWYVKGSSFFTAHAQLETLYNQTFDQIDELAELILQNGGKPFGSLKKFVASSTLEEYPDDFKSPENIFDAAKRDFESLRELALQIKKDADSEDNFLISAAMDEQNAALSKLIWMIGQSQM